MENVGYQMEGNSWGVLQVKWSAMSGVAMQSLNDELSNGIFKSTIANTASQAARVDLHNFLTVLSATMQYRNFFSNSLSKSVQYR